MTALRQQAYDLLNTMPDGDLYLVIDILEALKRNGRNPRRTGNRKAPFDFSKRVLKRYTLSYWALLVSDSLQSFF